MEQIQAITVGQQVFMVTWNGYNHSYQAGTVMKITPKGLFDVGYGSGELDPVRFNSSGIEIGRSYRKSSIDPMPFDERVAWLAEQELLKKVTTAITKIAASNNVKHTWGRDGLTEELDRLQGLITDARTLLAATEAK
jgi:hypothetical protein